MYVNKSLVCKKTEQKLTNIETRLKICIPMCHPFIHEPFDMSVKSIKT